MRVMFDVTDPVGRMHTMTKREGKTEAIDLKELLADDGDYLRVMSRPLCRRPWKQR